MCSKRKGGQAVVAACSFLPTWSRERVPSAQEHKGMLQLPADYALQSPDLIYRIDAK